MALSVLNSKRHFQSEPDILPGAPAGRARPCHPLGLTLSRPSCTERSLRRRSHHYVEPLLFGFHLRGGGRTLEVACSMRTIVSFASDSGQIFLQPSTTPSDGCTFFPPPPPLNLLAYVSLSSKRYVVENARAWFDSAAAQSAGPLKVPQLCSTHCAGYGQNQQQVCCKTKW
jgi:hypothetical protein